MLQLQIQSDVNRSTGGACSRRDPLRHPQACECVWRPGMPRVRPRTVERPDSRGHSSRQPSKSFGTDRDVGGAISGIAENTWPRIRQPTRSSRPPEPGGTPHQVLAAPRPLVGGKGRPDPDPDLWIGGSDALVLGGLRHRVRGRGAAEGAGGQPPSLQNRPRTLPISARAWAGVRCAVSTTTCGANHGS